MAVVNFTLSVKILILINRISVRVKSISIISVLIQEEEFNLVVTNHQVLLRNVDMLVAEIWRYFFIVYFHISDFYTPKVEPKICSWQFRTLKSDLVVPSVP